MSLPRELNLHLRDLLESGQVNSVLGAIPTRAPLGMAFSVADSVRSDLVGIVTSLGPFRFARVWARCPLPVAKR